MVHTIARRIEIDAGHRIMTHGSKCRHIHGHRYTIEATCRDTNKQLHESGTQTDMVLDFGFLKEELMDHIDAPCDHGFITAHDDLQVLEMFSPQDREFDEWVSWVRKEVERQGYCSTEKTRLQSKLYVIDTQPTAERLARHWYGRLHDAVVNRSDGVAKLDKIRVWETPNCWAEYSE
jgi:6-pyruvoyltetrahydropterin/6-carboxytetrahydropterin synthase